MPHARKFFHARGDFTVHRGHEAIGSIRDGDLRTQRVSDGRKFNPDGPPPTISSSLATMPRSQDGIGVANAFQIERYFRGPRGRDPVAMRITFALNHAPPPSSRVTVMAPEPARRAASLDVVDVRSGDIFRAVNPLQQFADLPRPLADRVCDNFGGRGRPERHRYRLRRARRNRAPLREASLSALLRWSSRFRQAEPSRSPRIDGRRTMQAPSRSSPAGPDPMAIKSYVSVMAEHRAHCIWSSASEKACFSLRAFLISSPLAYGILPVFQKAGALMLANELDERRHVGFPVFGKTFQIFEIPCPRRIS